MSTRETEMNTAEMDNDNDNESSACLLAWIDWFHSIHFRTIHSAVKVCRLFLCVCVCVCVYSDSCVCALRRARVCVCRFGDTRKKQKDGIFWRGPMSLRKGFGIGCHGEGFRNGKMQTQTGFEPYGPSMVHGTV